MPKSDVEELKDMFREHGDSNSLALRDVAANTELKQVKNLKMDTLTFCLCLKKCKKKKCTEERKRQFII